VDIRSNRARKRVNNLMMGLKQNKLYASKKRKRETENR
jgi:hypothetical protein